MAKVLANYPSKNVNCTYEILETRHKYFVLDLLSQEFSQMGQGPFKCENICTQQINTHTQKNLRKKRDFCGVFLWIDFFVFVYFFNKHSAIIKCDKQ